MAVAPTLVLVYIGQNEELCEILGLEHDMFEVVGGKDGDINLSKFTFMFRAKYMLSKAEVAQCRIPELEMVKLYMAKLEREHDIKRGLGWYAREEGEKLILYHIIENGAGLETIERLLKALDKYPTVDL